MQFPLVLTQLPLAEQDPESKRSAWYINWEHVLRKARAGSHMFQQYPEECLVAPVSICVVINK